MQNFIYIFDNFRVVDLFDILLLSFILYKFFSILHGTRALRILLGVCAIAILYWVSLSFELYGINWFLKHFFDYFFVIIIILFQEPIRTALANFGKTKFLLRKNEEYHSEQIEEVVTACSMLRKEKAGALIVFERSQGLLNYSLTGTRLDSFIHADILYSLFQNKSPLHDGAVILFQDKIQAAGCFLPLSKASDLERRYGTRHRAALGISEVSDALVVVVSEETGDLSVCNNGYFVACKNSSDLRKLLRQNLLAKINKVDFTLLMDKTR